MKGEKLNNIEAIDINNLYQPEPLSKRVVQGGVWVFALRVTNRYLGFIRTIILAHLLVPHDFGFPGITMVTINNSETKHDFDRIGGLYLTPLLLHRLMNP